MVVPALTAVQCHVGSDTLAQVHVEEMVVAEQEAFQQIQLSAYSMLLRYPGGQLVMLAAGSIAVEAPFQRRKAGERLWTLALGSSA